MVTVSALILSPLPSLTHRYAHPKRRYHLPPLRSFSRISRRDEPPVPSIAGAPPRFSNPFPSKICFDSQALQGEDLSMLSSIGPVPGDLAEIEAYCRIFRAVEQLQILVVETLGNPLPDKTVVTFEISYDDEEKIRAVLHCITSLLTRAREDVLSGRSSLVKSFEIKSVNGLDGKLRPLAVFRGHMKRCCESLHVVLENYLIPINNESTTIWRKLQRLKNVCYDVGFPRRPSSPCQTMLANWTAISSSVRKDDKTPRECDIAFWTGGQVTDEGLVWLLEYGFKTIIDLRAEFVKDGLYKAAIDHAVSHGMIDVVKLPIEVGRTPTVEQVDEFASLVSDMKRRPIYVHSQEGFCRTTALMSRWTQYVGHPECTSIKNHPSNSIEFLFNNMVGNGVGDGVTQNFIPPNLNEVNNAMLKGSHDSSNREFSMQGSGIQRIENRSSNNDRNATCCKDAETIHGTAHEETSLNFCTKIDLLKAPLPLYDVFSKRKLSVSLENEDASSLTFSNSQQEYFERFPLSKNMPSSMIEDSKILVGTQVSGVVQQGSSSGTFCEKDSVSNDIHDSAGFSVNNADGEQSCLSTKLKISSNMNGVASNTVCTAVGDDTSSGCDFAVDDGFHLVEGNMCASVTGVVRVQSRKKVEMFLVCRDGVSCAREKIKESSLVFTHPSTQQQMLMWKSSPITVLLLKKLGSQLMEEAKEVASFLHHEEKMNVLVEPDVLDIFARTPGFGFVKTFADTRDLHEKVDFVACLGGDGVILHASNMFGGAVPPVVSFNLGSMGFLTSHIFEGFRHDLRAIIHANNIVDGVYVTLRMRLQCEIFRKGKAVPGKVFEVLNEVVVDRGSNPYLSKIECYEHKRLITKVQGDGVIVATPTGSTAYSTAAGGSMVHPNVPCMLFTPICPHSLSFRPVILPDSAKLELKIPEDARSNAWVSFDGNRRQQLSKGDSVRISMSRHPLPTVNKGDQTGDWFRSLICCLNWNERLEQKAL